MPSELFERKLREKFAQAEVQPRPELWQTIEREISPPAQRGGLYLLLFEVLIIIGLLFMGSSKYFQLESQPTQSIANNALLGVVQHDTAQIHNEARTLALQKVPGGDSQSNRNESKEEKQEESLFASASVERHISQDRDQKSIHLNAQARSKSEQQVDDEGSDAPSQHPLFISTTDKFEKSQLNDEPEAKLSDITSTDKLEGVKNVHVDERINHRSYFLNSTHSAPAIFSQDPILSRRKKWSVHGYVSAFSAADRFAPFQLQEDLAVDYAYIYPIDLSVGSYGQVERLFSVSYPKKGLSVGLHLEYSLNQRFSLQSGLNYSWFEIGRYFIGEINPFLNSDLVAGPNSFNLAQTPISGPLTFSYNQLEIPLWLNIQFARGNRSYFQFSLGGAANFGFGTNRQLGAAELRNGLFRLEAGSAQNDMNSRQAKNSLTSENPELLQYNDLNFYAGAGISYHFHLNERLRLYTGPDFTYQLTPIYLGEGSNGQPPYRLGLKLGIAFTTRK